MTFRTLSLAGARLKLPFVRIHRVTVAALVKSKLLFEIASRMAADTTHLQMSARQRVFRFRMVKLHGRIDFFPACRRVTGFAGAFKRSFMWIGVAVRAGFKFHAAIFHRFVRTGREVAFFAYHLGMHASQRIFGFRVIELLRLFPVGDVVAALAIVAKLSFVDVLMAACAVLGKAHERGGKIFISNQCAQGWNHVRWCMALLARHGCMLFHKRIAGQPMIELLDGRFPMHQRKILAVVFQMAAHAILAIRIFHPQLRVVALIRGQSFRDFLVAFETFEGWCACPELMARSALRGTAEGFVGFGERTGRNLRARGRDRDARRGEQQQRK